MIAPTTLPADFPAAQLDASWGHWWRIHSAEYGPWYFASDNGERPVVEVGRFDLPSPLGTIYLAEHSTATAAESARAIVETHAESQNALDDRRLSQISLERWHGLRVADFTAPQAVPAQVEQLDRDQARPWAAAAHAAGFAGIVYRLREDPQSRRALAMFGSAGPLDVTDQPFAQPLPVGLRNDLLELFDGQYRGDPIAR